MRRLLILIVAVTVLTSASAFAQPQVSVSQSEVPFGGSVTVTITGTPGLNWALVGSSHDNGLVYGGVAFAIGTDVQLLGAGSLPGSGTVSLPVTPLLVNGVDTYYLQAVTANSPNFIPPTLSNAIALRPRGFYTNTPAFPSGLSAGGARIGNVGAPINPLDAVNKNYVDTSSVVLGGFSTRSTTSALIDVEQTNNGDLLRLRVNSTTLPNAGNSLISGQMFQVKADGGFVARGQLGIGTIPATGAGERLMWFPFKAAFRVGSAEIAGATNWDDANIGFYSVATGYNTMAMGLASNAFGYQSEALGSYGTAMGYTAVAKGTGSVALGYKSTACSDYGVAIGQRASTSSAPTSTETCAGTPHAGAIVIADASTTAHVGATANNEFAVRAAGGYRFYTNATLTTGVSLSPGGASWSVISDRNAKFGFEPIDEQDILRRLMTLPLSSFFYKDGDGRRYIGPMAQDFHAVFGLGTDETRIAMNDIDGVTLASLKALGAELEALRDANAHLSEQYAHAAHDNDVLRHTLDEVLHRLTALEAQHLK